MTSHALKEIDYKLTWKDKISQWLSYDSPQIVSATWNRICDFWYQTKCFFFPRQKWLLNNIPRTHVWSYWLVPEVLYNIIIHFVDEGRFEEIDWPESFEGGADFEKKVMECYDWIKFGRFEFQEGVDAALPPFDFEKWFSEREDGENGSISFLTKPEDGAKYEEHFRLEEEYEKIESFWLNWIVQNRKHL